MSAVAAEVVRVGLFDMVLAFSRAMDLLHPAISEHHLRVAYVAGCMAEELGWPADAVLDVVVAGALHDVAAVCSPDSRRLLDYALMNHLSSLTADIHAHAHEGYLLLGGFAPFASAAQAIRFHHVDWKFGEGRYHAGQPVPLAGHLLHVADQAAVLPTPEVPAVVQAQGIRDTLRRECGSQFHPELVDIFDIVSAKESFWLDLTSKHKENILRQRFQRGETFLHIDGLDDLAKVFGRIVDYRSSYTAVHSRDVGKVSSALAERIGLDAPRARLVGIAGYLHDVGKLAVPPDLLDKPGRLTAEEMLVVRQHPYYTHQILSTVPGLGTICEWASYHHERVDGRGYPFRPRELPLEARIVSVADIFTAITEDRPYRRGMKRTECLQVLSRLVDEGAIDGDLVSILHSDYEAILDVRTKQAT